MPDSATILICDDEDVLRSLVRASLRGRGYEIVEARDGDEAVQLAAAERPDLILLDMMMPGRTGLEVLETLQDDPRLERTPVLMLTARTQETDRAAASGAGALRFLPKPFSPFELADVVEEMLETG